jgi:serine/threonine protein kinase
MPLGEGSVLGRRYRLVAQIGRGGMGKVWRAHDDLLHREVAVKEVLFPPGLTSAERAVLYERTLREARSAARLSHRGIVTVHDVVEEDGRPWIVMEYVRARSLQEVIDQEGPLPPRQVAEIGRQMLAALRSAHDAGVLHRDIKPANVLLAASGTGGGAPRVVITDFGIARMTGDSTLTQTGLVLGSPAYIAPERARGEHAVAASDLWALGATLYAACEGQAPHDREEAMAALTAVLTEDPPPPPHAGPLTPVIMGLLANDPARRMTTGQAAEELTRVARDVPRPSPPPAGPPQSPDPAATVYDVPDTMTLLDPPASPAWPQERGRLSVPSSLPVPGWQPPGPGPAGPPAPDRPARRRPGWKIVLSAGLVVLVVLSVVMVLAYRAAHSDPAAARADPLPASPTASPPASPPASPSASPARSPATTPPGSPPGPPPGVPAGYQRSGGPEGATLAVPPGWTRKVRSAASVTWSDPVTGAYVQLDSIPWGVTDPVEHWARFTNEVVSKKRLPGFRRTRLGPRFVARGWPAADLEYTWMSATYGRLRAYDRGFTAGGRQYAIMVAAPEVQWSRYSGLVNTTFTTFRPAP